MDNVISKMFGMTTRAKLHNGNIISLPGIPPAEVNSLMADIKKRKIKSSSMPQMNISSPNEEETLIRIEDIEIVLS